MKLTIKHKQSELHLEVRDRNHPDDVIKVLQSACSELIKIIQTEEK
jgi:hypothetical protein